jgi:hypothetical protein
MKRALIKNVMQSPGLFMVDYHDRDELDEYESSQQFKILSYDYYNTGVYAS